MKKILITTFGTWGDIQSYIALGKELKAAGYSVAICTPEGFSSAIREHKIEHLVMDNDLLELTQAGLGETGGIGETLSIARKVVPAVRHSMDEEWDAARTFQPDLIIYHPKCLGSFHIAEKLQLPAIVALPLPFYTPTKEFPVPFWSGIQLGGWFNRLSYHFMAGMSTAMYRGTINDFRVKTLALSPMGSSPDLLVRSDGTSVPVLYPYSAHLLPVPEDFPPHVHVTGYWFLDRSNGWHPESRLVDFLQSGTPPVYVGFGSMGAKGAAKRTKIILEALEKSGQRGVLASGWGGLSASNLPSNIFMVNSVPHDWLFPQMAAVVHHGGAGTTAAGLRAGKPTIICPFLGDQPFWGKIIYKQGVGPKPIPEKQISANRLVEALVTTLQDESLKQRAAALGAKIRAENGVARAIEIIDTIINETVGTP